MQIVQNNSGIERNQNSDEHTNSKLNQKKDFVHQTSPKLKTKTSQKERKNRKMTKKIYHRIKKRNLNIENHHDLEVSHEKIMNFHSTI